SSMPASLMVFLSPARTRSPQESEKPRYATVLTPFSFIFSTCEPIMMLMGWGTEKVQGFLSGVIGVGDKEIWGVLSSAATPATAMADGTLVEPMMRSTLSS